MRRRVSYRLSLAVAVPLLVAVTGGAVIAYSHSRARHHIEVNTAERFRRVSTHTADEARAYLMRAVPIAHLARGLMEEAGAAVDGPPEAIAEGRTQLARRFVAFLRANPELSWVTYGDERGTFTGAQAVPGGYRTNLSQIAGGKTAVDEYAVDEHGAWTHIRHNGDTGYDPRTRPFYVAARERGGLIFTPPYVFFDQGVPGITCGLPRFAPPAEGGALRGVLTVDFDLNRLSQFVAGLRLSPRGEVFITTSDQVLVAHPTTRLVETVGQGLEGRLLTVADVGDPAVEAVAAHAAAGRRGFFAFEAGGRAWYGSVTEMRLDGGQTWLVGAAAPQSDFTAGLDRDLRTMLLVNLVVLALAIAGGVVLANGVSRPLTSLARDMAEIGQFRLDDRPSRASVFREIELMHEALARTRGGLRSFAAYVPRDLVRAVLASGHEARLEGEVRELTVFFSDIAGFTTYAETRTPHELVEMLGRYLDEVTTVVAAHEGTVDKFLGDGVMAFWGAPAETPGHAALACEAAVRIQRRLAASPVTSGTPLATRIGLASGEVLVGNIGSHERMNYTVMGDVVNLAARLEALNKQYGTAIMIAEPTYRAAAERIVARPVDVVAVKGKARAVRVYEVLGLASDGGPDADLARALARHAEHGLERYLARDFADAIRAFEAVLLLRPDDGPATRFIERCRALAAEPPPTDWDGVFHATEK